MTTHQTTRAPGTREEPGHRPARPAGRAPLAQRVRGGASRAPVRRPSLGHRRRALLREHRAGLLLALATVALTLLVVVFTDRMPTTALMVPLLVGSLLLGPRTLPWFVVVVMACVTVQIAVQPEITERIAAATVVQFLMGLIVLVTALRRARLGVAGVRGESMFVDLRDRILTQGRVPELPEPWDVQTALRSAGGTPFAGDFVVATTLAPTPDAGHRLELVVVDVSGKGEQAGTRALLLSGAFGGLLGALPSERFLPAANDYLLRQGWDEGFATAVHLSLDLTTGSYEVRTAGHPPALHRLSGSGRWQVLRGDGPVLGVMEAAEYPPQRGRLGAGDAVLLYTDGMVEEPRRDIDLGIDALQGAAEAMLRGGTQGAAGRLADALGSPDDDRAVVLVRRH